MKSEEKLNKLFDALRKENTNTSVSEIASWVGSKASNAKTKKVNKYNYFKLVMTSTIISTFIVAIILLPIKREYNSNDKNVQLINNYKITNLTDSIYTSDSSEKKLNENNQYEIPFSNSKANSITPINKINTESIINNETQYPIDLSKYSKNDINEKYPQTNIEKATGVWRSLNDSLKVDTLFKGVKLIVFITDFNLDVIVNGCNRTDVALNYNHQLKVKGIYTAPKDRYCELNCVLADSILTVHCNRENYIFNGISIIRETNNLRIDAPKNISVQIQPSSGDIDLELLNPISEYSLDLITEVGEIKERRKELKLIDKTHLVTESGLFKISIKAYSGNINIR
ncbi:MAG: hypothetical protein ACK5U7_00840 [Bacteroidota bacterium]|jgi:hypothetical protein